jgi:hypothetical protein
MKRDEVHETGPLFAFRRWFLEAKLPEQKCTALMAALKECANSQLPPPAWLIQKTQGMFWHFLNNSRTGRGRYANFQSRTRQFEIQGIRWVTVLHFRQKLTWEKSYEAAADDLAATIAAASADRMKASYQAHARYVGKVPQSYIEEKFSERHSQMSIMKNQIQSQKS